MGSGALQSQYLSRLSQAPDQLRQRVAYALSQIIVISMNKNIYPDEVVPYLQILSRNAFGNYRTLLGEISVSSQMGKYLDLAKSTKPGAGGGANENYAREVMQLFSIGLYMLNPDGSQQLDAQGHPIPTYNQATIQQVALALTGWVYPNNAWEDFSGPMVPLEANHDTTQKTFLGCTLPAGQTTTQDMNGFLDCLFNHPNVGPFIATRLIRSLVTSNPSPAYIQRIATVFNNNGAGVRGDLRAVVKAILTDAEARNDAAPPTSGPPQGPHLPHGLVCAGAEWKHLSIERSVMDVLAAGPRATHSSIGIQLLLAVVPDSAVALFRSRVSNLHAHGVHPAREFPVGDHIESCHRYDHGPFALHFRGGKHAAVDRCGRSGFALWPDAAADAPEPGERNRGTVRQQQPSADGALSDGAVGFLCSPILRHGEHQ